MTTRRPPRTIVALACAFGLAVVSVVWDAGPASAETSAYVLTTDAGELTAFGDITPPATPALADTVDLDVVNGGAGAHVLGADGTIVSAGTSWVPDPVDTSGWRTDERAVALVMTPTEAGAWLVTTEGRVATLGDASPMGDMTWLALAAPIIDAAATGSTGLYLLGGDGGIFTLGTARFHGSVPQVLPGVTLDEPLVGIVVTPTGAGYWLVAADGGLFAFGDAPFVGSIPQILPGVQLNAPVVGAVSYGSGYLLVAGDGGVFNFSDLPFAGSLGDDPPADPIVGISPRRSVPAADTSITVWHDVAPDFGQLGVPQRWVNVQGTVTDPDGVTEFEYRLNGGGWVTMQIGPDPRRLDHADQFNIDLLVDSLVSGANRLEIRATDANGERSTLDTTVTWTPGIVAPTDITIGWAGVTRAVDVAQPVDGEWRTDGAWLNNVDDGYDRIIAIGDRTWTDYEVTVPVILHSIHPDADVSPSNGPGLGFALRWNGHNDSVEPGSQPQVGFQPDGVNPTPFGAVLFWRDAASREPGFELYDDRNRLKGSDASLTLVPSTTYVFRAQVEGAAPTTYRWKMWEQGTSEPSSWTITYTTPGASTEPSSGSLALIAHEVDASFGTVTVRGL